jgi:hypothetical protein
MLPVRLPWSLSRSVISAPHNGVDRLAPPIMNEPPPLGNVAQSL